MPLRSFTWSPGPGGRGGRLRTGHQESTDWRGADRADTRVFWARAAQRAVAAPPPRPQFPPPYPGDGHDKTQRPSGPWSPLLSHSAAQFQHLCHASLLRFHLRQMRPAVRVSQPSVPCQGQPSCPDVIAERTAACSLLPTPPRGAPSGPQFVFILPPELPSSTLSLVKTQAHLAGAGLGEDAAQTPA